MTFMVFSQRGSIVQTLMKCKTTLCSFKKTHMIVCLLIKKNLPSLVALKVNTSFGMYLKVKRGAIYELYCKFINGN